MTNETAGNRLGTADRHLISVIGDQVIQKYNHFEDSYYFQSLTFRTLSLECFWQE